MLCVFVGISFSSTVSSAYTVCCVTAIVQTKCSRSAIKKMLSTCLHRVSKPFPFFLLLYLLFSFISIRLVSRRSGILRTRSDNTDERIKLWLVSSAHTSIARIHTCTNGNRFACRDRRRVLDTPTRAFCKRVRKCRCTAIAGELCNLTTFTWLPMRPEPDHFRMRCNTIRIR